MVAIGRGLMTRPRLLLIDELSLGLAPVIVDRLIDAIKVIKADKELAILLVDQDVQVAFSLADRGYVMEMGREVLQGRSDELAANPKIKEAYLGL
jgi:branched-chain amino acid transport system ATP-binding protein